MTMTETFNKLTQTYEYQVLSWTQSKKLESELLLYIDLRPGQTCHSKVMHRKEVTHSDGSYEKK